MPPFKVMLDKADHEVEIIGVKVYPHAIWFLDGFNNEYFNGENVTVRRVPYIPPRAPSIDHGKEF